MLHETYAIVQRAVHVLGHGDTDTVSGLYKIVATLFFDDRITDPQRTIRSAVFIAAPLKVLHLFEIWQDIFIPPAWVAQGTPAVKILLMTADEYHAVDGAGSTEQFAPRPVHLTPLKFLHWRGAEIPVQ
ncbi:hypothetical protein D3C85_1247020 [compost metagenome]